MKTGARVAAVVIGVALYSVILAIVLLELLGPRETLTLVEIATGQRCTGDCSARHVLSVLAITLPFTATFPALVIMGVIWIRRGARGDRELKVIDGWLATNPAVVQPDPEPEPEPQKFYRDRQGRLRPLKSALEDDFSAE